MKAVELNEKLKAGEHFILLDIREPEEVASVPMVSGARNVPMGKVFTEAAAGNLPKGEKIITICKSGGRCAVVVRELAAKGYDIDLLEGGMNEWSSLSE